MTVSVTTPMPTAMPVSMTVFPMSMTMMAVTMMAVTLLARRGSARDHDGSHLRK